MAKNSDVETFCAMRLFIDSWRWEGVPWYPLEGSGSFTQISPTSVRYNFDNVVSPASAVPEPASVFLLLSGVTLLSIAHRRFLFNDRSH